ncbi:calmodulin-like protein 3 [Salvia splendens]|nr:calmodulin-like protein 3 [Salvia splendens]
MEKMFKAYMEISEDPETGTNQTEERFWWRVSLRTYSITPIPTTTKTYQQRAHFFLFPVPPPQSNPGRRGAEPRLPDVRQGINASLEKMGIFIPRDELAEVIARVDVNGDANVSIDEFSTLYQTIMDERNEDEDMKEAFDVFDRNGDGFISVEEVSSVLASLGQGRGAEECEKMIEKVDADGDGRVDFNEFRKMMNGGRE